VLTTTQARIHTGCQFHLKGGDFLLDSASDTLSGVLVRFTSLTEFPDREMEVMADHVEDEMWNLVICNFPAEHQA
jgi:hypothetical protein